MMCAPGLEGEWARLYWLQERRRARRQVILNAAALAVLLSLLFITGD